MKKSIFLLCLLVMLIGLGWAWSVLVLGALPSSWGQPLNTPAPPEERSQAVLAQLPSSLAGDPMPERLLPPAPTLVLEEPVKDLDYEQRAGRLAQALRQTGRRFSITQLESNSVGTPPSAPACRTVLLNPQMDVVEFGDGTGSIEHWAVIAQNIYYDNRSGYYNSASHSLVMVDDPGFDTAIISTTLDWDAFGQGFQAPGALTVITVTYSRLYSNTNTSDTAWGNLWTLDSQGYLDDLVTYWPIGESPSGWSNRTAVFTDSATLAALAGKPLALVFDVEANRESPYEIIWLDDAQVTICYQLPPNHTYLPLVMRQYGQGGVVACVPYEPDSVNQRGSTVVGATCYGSFSAVDMKDYYSLNLNGVTQVRLSLSNLPSGTNWDAAIYEDAPGYPLACHIGTPGSGDKYKDCSPLDPARSYFVLVNAGTAPGGGANTYQMSVTSRVGPTPTPSLSPGIYGE